MRKILLLTALAAMCAAGCGEAPRTATLHVSTANLAQTGTNIYDDGQLAFIARPEGIELEPGEELPREITIELDKPGYYMIFRNPMYLSPGDDLTIDLWDDNEKTTFAGVGAEANTYLSHRYYSKGGSFLDAGSLLRGRPVDFDIVAVLDSLVALRRDDLAALQGVSREFRELEEIRIKADFINSLIYFPNYNNGMVPQDITREEYDGFISDYYTGLKDRVQPILDELASDDRYLDIEVVRLVLYRLMDNPAFDVKVSDRFRKLVEVTDKAQGIRGNITPAQYAEMAAYGETIPYADMKEVYMNKLEVNSRLMEGKPAVEVALKDMDGNAMKLSDLADKPMYIDIWATWCGPCLAESPYFEALSHEYPGIRFVAVSVDGDEAAWKRHLEGKEHGAITEVLATDDMRKNWDIVGIPRFLLIDSDFNIISANAPRPSQSDEIRALLDKWSVK